MKGQKPKWKESKDLDVFNKTFSHQTEWPTKWVQELDGAKQKVHETEQFYEGFAGTHGVTLAVNKSFIAPRRSFEKSNYHFFTPKVNPEHS